MSTDAAECNDCGCPDNIFYLVGWDSMGEFKVYLHNLEFWVQAADLIITGRGMDFEWSRIYRSMHGPNTEMGNGWTHSYDISIAEVVPGDDSELWLGDGAKGRRDKYYMQPDGMTWAADGFFRIITRNADNSFTLTCADASEWHFHALDENPEAGMISTMGDSHGNEMLFFYADGNLIEIIDTLGGHINISYNPEGFIESVEHDNGQMVSYDFYNGVEYGGVLGDLKSVTSVPVIETVTGNDFVDGLTTTYYYPYGNLGVINANGQDITNVIYDSEEKVKECHKPGAESFTKFFSTSVAVAQKGSLGTTDGISAAALAADTKVIVNDAVGNVTEYLINAKNETVNARIYTGRAGRWTVTTETENRPTNKLRPEDPNYFEISWQYNEDSQPTEILYPNRNITQKIYQLDLDPNSTRLTRGNLRYRIHIPGPLGGDQNTITEEYEYKDGLGTCDCGNSLVTRYVDGRGNETLHDYDDDGNRIRTTHVMPGPAPDIVEEWRYNHYGQMTEHIHPDGRVDLFIYYSDGPSVDYNGDGCVNLPDLAMFCSVWLSFGNRIADTSPVGGDGVVDTQDLEDLQLAWLDCVNLEDLNPGYLKHKIVDSRHFALTTTYEYNARGEVVRQIDPQGNDTRFIRNQLGWIVRTISPEVVDGSGIYYERDTYYDGMGNVVRRDVQNKDENGVLQSNTHFTTISEYNVLNELVRECTESGSYTGPIGGTADQPSCAGLPASEFITKEYEYDAKHNLKSVISGEAVEGRQPTNIVRTLYDERDLVFKQIRADGDLGQSTTQYDYDGNGNVKKTMEGLEDNPHIKLNTHDGYDRLVSSTDPMGNISTYHYDGNGNQVSLSTDGELTDVHGNAGNVRLSQSTYIFDAMDRLIRKEDAFFEPNTQMAISDGNSVTTTEYSVNSQIIRVTNDNSHAAETTYDTANRALTVTDAKGNTFTYTYDENSNLISATTVEKSDLGAPDETFTTTSTYDGLNRLIRRVDNVGNTQTYSYDSRSNLTHSVDTLDHERRYVRDGINRLVQTVRDLDDDGADGDGDDITTRQTWDDTSRLTGRIDDNGNTTSYAYDALNRLMRTTYADGTQHTTIYDVHNNRIEWTDASGSAVISNYDLLDRMMGKTIVAGAGVSNDTTFEDYTYDGLSRLVRAEDNDSVVTRSYDSLSRLTRETLNGQTTACIYDGVANQTQCTYPGGRVIKCAYDALERKKTIDDTTAGTQMIATYDYIGRGRVERREYGNGTRTDYTYDGINGIPNPPDDFGVKRIIRTTHSKIIGGSIIDDRTYRWNKMYNKTQRKDIRAGGPQLTHDYIHDNIDRLVHTTVTNAAAVVVRDTGYDLDGVGNRNVVLGAPDAGSHMGPYTMDPTLPEPADEQMNQYTTTPPDQRIYDKNGNLARIDDGLPTRRDFAYDYRNQMVEYTVIATGERHTYAYDPLGRRIARTIDADGVSGGPTETRYFYNTWQVVEEQNGVGATQATYVYGLYIDEALNMQRGGVGYYYHTDDLYNVMAVTDGTAVVRERHEYADSGSAVDPTTLAPIGGDPSALSNPYLFQGRRLDPETGLNYFRNRYYDPGTGRFIQRDPVWDPDNLGNQYTFVGNNPINSTDPLGLYKLQEVTPPQCCAKWEELWKVMGYNDAGDCAAAGAEMQIQMDMDRFKKNHPTLTYMGALGGVVIALIPGVNVAAAKAGAVVTVGTGIGIYGKYYIGCSGEVCTKWGQDKEIYWNLWVVKGVRHYRCPKGWGLYSGELKSTVVCGPPYRIPIYHKWKNDPRYQNPEASPDQLNPEDGSWEHVP